MGSGGGKDWWVEGIRIGWERFEEREGATRHVAAMDDLGEDANAILKVKFVKGRRYIIRVRVHYVMSPEGVALLVF